LEWARAKGVAMLNDHSVNEIFADVVAERPDAVAVICSAKRLTYRELDGCAQALADELRAAGTRPGEVVGFTLPRGMQALSAMLAILKCDCAYLPLDPKLPEARRRLLLGIAGPTLLITTDGIVRLRSEGPRCPDVRLPDGVAFVLFTSGSTGVPKAVCVPHRAVARLVREVDYMRLAPDIRFLQLAPLSFDASTLEIWGPLLNGGTVVIHPEDVPDLAELGRTIDRNGVTTAWLTASLFNQVIDTTAEILRPLQELVTGGEALSVPHVLRALAALPETSLINGYGPTEATTFTTTFRIPRDFGPGTRRVPIGRPLPDTQVYVLDEHQQLVPIGVPGEIYIGGDGLALGYLGDEALTAAKFVSDPISNQPGARLYRSGDLGRMLPDGNLDFIERLDRQVKIRGYRIELGEIESALLRCPGVSRAVVVVDENSPADKRLVAYVVPDPRIRPTADELRAHLLQDLPEYLVPNAYVLRDALPLMLSGKVDHKAIAGLEDAKRAQGPRAAPSRTPLEEVLAGIWANILEVDQVGADENFFALGGHSLLAIRLIQETNSAFGVELPVRALFASPTIAAQAREIERLRAASNPERPGRHPPLVPLRPQGNKPPFFLVAGGFGGEDELIVYAGLTRYLDRQRPFYGLRIRGVDDLVEPHKTVEAMAVEYVAEIRKVQAHGPYFIGGSCLGGIVALEIAQQLVANGEKVESLILIDSNFLSWSSFLRYRIWRVWHLEILPLMRGLRQKETKFWNVLKGQIVSRTSPSPEQKEGREKVRIGLTYLQRVRRYKPKPYHGPITHIVCERGAHGLNSVWYDVARASLDIQYVPGDHYTHLRKYAAVTAARLNACLKAAGD
jgi:amino acid adenylation domain-containing protein